MNSADVRDWDPGDGRIFPPAAAPAPSRSEPSVNPSGPATAGHAPTSTVPACTPAPAVPVPSIRSEWALGWTGALDHFREGLVVCDAAGVVRYASAVAHRLLPGVVPGQLLTASGVDGLVAAARSTGTAEFSHGGRRIRVRRQPLDRQHRGWYVEDVTESVRRADALLAERSRSGFLAAASQKLGNPLHIDRAARAAVRLAVPMLGDVAVVVLAPRAGRVRWWRARGDDSGVALIDGAAMAAADLPPMIVEALGGNEPSAADWLVEQVAETGWVPGLRVHEMCARVVPLPGSGSPTGALVVAGPVSRVFEDPDVEVLRGFAARAGAALNAALLYRDQAEVAETLQSSLLPVVPAEVPGIQWGTAYRPSQATLRIGGDFYGTHPLPDGRSLFYLGDVSGKGVEAAVFTGQLRQGLQALRRVETDPQRLLRLLNDAVLETAQANKQGRFATMVLGLAQPTRDGGLTLTLAGGGHLPPLLLRATGAVESIDLHGMLIGVVPDPRIGQTTVRLGPGETCLLYSDGVTEARGGRRGDEQYGSSRLAHALADCHRMPAPALAERVEQVTCDWLAGGEHDDIAVLAVRAGPTGTSRHLRAVPDLASQEFRPQ